MRNKTKSNSNTPFNLLPVNKGFQVGSTLFASQFWDKQNKNNFLTQNVVVILHVATSLSIKGTRITILVFKNILHFQTTCSKTTGSSKGVVKGVAMW